VKLAQEHGYLTVSNTIDPKDWEQPGAASILQRIKDGRHLGSVILLHDAGGDREQTVEALPAIIDYLLARGDRIVSLGELIGVPPEALMPPLSQKEPFLTRVISDGGLEVLRRVENFLWAFMIVATGLIVVRTLAVIILAISQKRRQTPAAGAFQPPLTVLIAAYNEEMVIAETLGAILRSDYSGEVEVLVVDDGSTDRTAEVVEKIAQADSRLRLIRRANQGKARALRAGLVESAYDFVAMLDADTQFQPDTLRHLIGPLSDPMIAAVSGHARVGNQRTFLARCQSLEYICSFNLDRRAYHQLNCITVAPGAVSAFRKSAIHEAGGISIDTLAEDTDLTLGLHRAGFRIAYAPAAVAWTEAPESFTALAGQRFRWAYGTMQCLWKRRDMIFNTRYKALGWFSLPSICFFQILLVAIVPLVDAFLIFSLLFGMGGAIYVYFLAFLLSDLLLAMLACGLEGEPVITAWRILPMRFIYRPLLALVIWKSIFRACKGAWVGWGKLGRTASVSLPAGGK
jgi:cellulose synthase/poly-beta-1,6-N-acetylglucosamine synthase-like glycosyltransferase